MAFRLGNIAIDEILYGVIQNFDDEIKTLLDFWVDNGIMFRPSDCVLYESVKGKENLAYDLLPPVLDEFISYDLTHSMADDKENVEDLDLFVTE